MSANWTPLNGLNQMAPRSYNRFALCFSVENSKISEAVKHLKLCVAKLSKACPALASLLMVNTPTACIKQIPGGKIPVEDLDDVGRLIRITYAKLQKEGFPASYFVHDVFDISSDNEIPALIVRIYRLDGGLILGLHLHHSFGDGHELRTLIRWLSAESRGDTVNYGPISFSVPLHGLLKIMEGECVNDLPEWKLRSRLGEPTEERAGEIFRFDLKELEAIRNGIGEGTSTNIVLAALTWAHATKARFDSLRISKGTTGRDDRQIGDKSRLLIPVDVRKRVFQEKDIDQYFGNATELSLSCIDTNELLKACERTIGYKDEPDEVSKRMKPLTRHIQEAIAHVNPNFVKKRLSLYNQESDPRKFEHDADLSDRNAFIFNYWRYIGNDEMWDLNKTGPRYPDCGRRIGGQWNGPAGVVMPQLPKKDHLEVMITLERSALSMLKGDRVFGELAKWDA
ncbi:hypothetical protein F5Y16DRAFT_414266 [Xylariaceae sp. FL0255]|nr:hypothetical protein F5Y16DRAFT_414266 [Xylariaceae sp. FL0255]